MIAIALLVLAAQDPNLDAEAGFGGSSFTQSWSRILVSVFHDGASIDAELRITLKSFSQEPVIYRKPFPIGRKARMRVGVDVFLTGLETEADVELLSNGKTLQKKVVQPNFIWGPDHRLLAVGPMPDVFTDGLGKESKVSVVRTTAELFPSSETTLRALDTIVMPEPLDLTIGQEEALRRWVALGGRLVFFASRSTALRQHPLWREWCPLADPRIAAATVPGQAEAVTLVRGALRKGRIVQSLGTDPVAIVAPEGSGQVVFVAIPPDQASLRRLFPGKFLVPALLDLPPPPKEEPKVRRPIGGLPPPRGLAVQEVEPLVRRLIPWETPLRAASIGVGGGLGLIYVLVIGPLHYFRLRRKGTLRRGWMSFGLTALAAIPIVLVWGGAFAPRPPKLAMMQLWDEGRVQTFAILKSPAGGLYDVEAPGAFSPLAPALAYGARTPLAPIAVDLPSHTRLAVPPGASRLFCASRDLATERPFFTAAWKDREARTLVVSNPTSTTLREGWVVSADRVWQVDPPLPGKTREVELDAGKPVTAWTTRIKSIEGGQNLWSLRPDWDTPHVPYFGLILSLCEAMYDAQPGNRDRHVVLQRGLDRSEALKRGECLFLGAYDQDVSELKTEPPVAAAVYGWIRVRVQEPVK